ncbi:FG-GAP-like repeat-containing protein [Kutzneria sp. NPDC052558]|uniref:FG-GAP-like repeat-containing protein n=1 Tax=Kutzneria sp. NPDC052558 TaxID=3364121 RepID=UPI0037CC720C
MERGTVVLCHVLELATKRVAVLLMVVSVVVGVLAVNLVAAPAAHADTLRDAIVAKAASQVGVRGDSRGCQPYGDCEEWCADFANWVWRNAGVNPVPTTRTGRGEGKWGLDHGLFKARPDGQMGNPLPGDMVVFGPPAEAAGGHVAIVESVNDNGTITTINGNFDNAVRRWTINPITARTGTGNYPISGYVTPPGAGNSAPPPGASLSGDARAEIVALQTDGTARAWYNNLGFDDMPWGGDSKTVATGLGAPDTVRLADLDGDGRKEFISIQPNGDIIAWYNALGFADMPWGGQSKKIGAGFTDPSRVFFADLSGDGKAEIIALQPDGTLTAWYNALGFADMPWGPSKTIGTGFSDPARIRFADLSGDGRAEIMSIQSDGTITAWYNALGFETMPWGPAKTVGTGFTDPSRVLFADLSGDGKAEIASVQPDGTIIAWYNALGFADMPWGPSKTVGTGFTEPNRVLFA